MLDKFIGYSVSIDYLNAKMHLNVFEDEYEAEILKLSPWRSCTICVWSVLPNKNEIEFIQASYPLLRIAHVAHHPDPD